MPDFQKALDALKRIPTPLLRWYDAGAVSYTHLDVYKRQVEGDIFSWDYEITDAAGEPVAHLSKELLRLTDTYVLEFPDPCLLYTSYFY